jgi:hypothetical protein
MRTEEEIRVYLAQLEKEYEHLHKWSNEAHDKYEKERRYWGKEADMNEIEYVATLIIECDLKKHLMKWVLGESETR